jgi:hypothetical protein
MFQSPGCHLQAIKIHKIKLQLQLHFCMVRLRSWTLGLQYTCQYKMFKPTEHMISNLIQSNVSIDIRTVWSRVLLERLTSSKLVKKFPIFYRNWWFINVFTGAHHLSLSWARSIQSMSPNPTSWRSILILSYHLCLGFPSGLFPSGFPIKTLYTPLLSPMHTTCPTHHILLDLIIWMIFGEQYRSWSSSLGSFLHSLLPHPP